MKKALHTLLLSALALATMQSATLAQGVLSGTITPDVGLNVNLTADGVTDWSHWGLNGVSQDHKAVGGTAVGLISDQTQANASYNGNYTDNFLGFSWTDGTPTASASNSTTGLYEGNGSFSFTVAASTASQTLKVYVGGVSAGAGFSAHLSDNSAPDYLDGNPSFTAPVTGSLNSAASAAFAPDGNHFDGVYTITFKAASAGQTLTITYGQTAGSGNITLQAATLFPTPTTPPVAPTGLVATAFTGRVVLAFNIVPDVNSYNVYRSTSASGPFTQIATGLTSTNYIDTGLTNGTTYYYEVTAVNTIGEGAFSNVASATPQVGIDGTGLTGAYYLGGNNSSTSPGGMNFNFATATPNFTELDPTVNFNGPGNTVGNNPNAWPAQVNAQPNDFSAQWTGAFSVPLTGSYVLATNSDDGSGVYLDGILVVNNLYFQGPTLRSSNPIMLTAGVKHSLRVPYFQGGGGYTMQLLWTPPGQAQQIIPASALYPDATQFAPFSVTLVAIPASGSSITLTYNVPDNATSFNVLRSPTTGGPYTKVGTGTTSGSFTDTGLTSGVTYYYVVQAVNAKGTSANSNEASAAPVPPIIGNGNGLLGTYYAGGNTDFSAENTTPILTAIAPTVNYNANGNTTIDNPVNFPAGVPATNFTAVYSGQFLAPFTGSYQFQTITDDGARLTIDTDAATGVVLFTDMTGHGPLANTGAPVTLTAGKKYTIKFEYFQGTGGDTAQLLYSPLNSGFVIIPQSQLFTVFTVAPSAPTNLTAFAGNGVVTLNFTGGANAGSYSILRSTTMGGPYTTIATNVTGTTYADTTVTNGTKYYYVVAAVNNIGTSANSNEASATPFKGLILSYNFENGPSGLDPDPIMDISGNGNTGFAMSPDVPGADAGFTHDSAAGNWAGISVDATHYLALPTSLNLGNTFTFFTFVKLASDSAGGNIQPIFATSRSGGNSGGFAFYVNDYNNPASHDLVVETNTGPGTNIQSKATSPLNTFQFDGNYHAVAVTVDRTAGLVNIYYNGQNVLSNAAIDTQWPTMTGDNRLGEFANGDIIAINSEFDNVALYNYLLTPAQIAALSVISTVTGTVALEGVADLSAVSPYSPLGTFTVTFRMPGTTTVVKTSTVTLATTAGSPNGTFTVTGLPAGTYDVLIKGSKNLAVLSPNVVVSATSGTVPAVTLPAGDTNNDNFVDSSDFGTLIGAFNTDGSIPGSGYDPTADLNFDGLVDSSDFGLLIGEFNNAGAM